MTGRDFGIVALVVLALGLVVDAIRVRFKRRRIVDAVRHELMAPPPPSQEQLGRELARAAGKPDPAAGVTAQDVERAEAALQLLAGGDKGKGDRP